MNNHLRTSLSITMIIVLSILTSCGSTSTEGYRTFTDRNEICGLTFNYPGSYTGRDGPRVVKYEGGKYFDVGLLPPRIDKTLRVSDVKIKTPGSVATSVQTMAIGVYVLKGDNPDYSAQRFLEGRLKSDSRMEHYKLLQRSKITVSSIEAEKVTYEVDGILQPREANEPSLTAVSVVCFDYGGLLWIIYSTCHEEYRGEYRESVRRDLDLVLATFKILSPKSTP